MIPEFQVDPQALNAANLLGTDIRQRAATRLTALTSQDIYPTSLPKIVFVKNDNTEKVWRDRSSNRIPFYPVGEPTPFGHALLEIDMHPQALVAQASRLYHLDQFSAPQLAATTEPEAYIIEAAKDLITAAMLLPFSSELADTAFSLILKDIQDLGHASPTLLLPSTTQ